jgi:O-antigen/teichoic acid export membrane protein
MSEFAPYMRRAAATGIVNSIASAVAVVLFLPRIVAQAGLDNYGLWSVIFLFVGVSAALDLGLTPALVYLVPREPARAGELLLTAACISAVACGLVVGMIMLLASLGSGLLGPLISADSRYQRALLSCGAIVMIASVETNLLRGLLEANLRLDVVNIGYAALTVLNYSSALVVTTFTHHVVALLVSSAVVYVAVFLGHAVAVVRLFNPDLRQLRLASARILCRTGVESYLALKPAVLLVPTLQFLLARAATSGGQYGIFDLAMRISTLCATTIGSIAGPFYAIVAGAAPTASRQLRRTIHRYVFSMVAIGVLAWVAFVLVGNPLLRLLFARDSTELHRIATIMLAGGALLASLDPISRMLLGLGRRRQLFAVSLAMLAVGALAARSLLVLPILERFAVGYAVGYAVAAAGLLYLNSREAWGRA